MLKKRLVIALAAAGLMLGGGLAGAEDIDVYSDNGSTSDLPNVLLIVDNSANWTSTLPNPNGQCSYNDGTGSPYKRTGTDKDHAMELGAKVAAVKCALYNTILALDTTGGAKFNVAIMLFNHNVAATLSGGYPRQAFLPLTAANKTIILNKIRNIWIDDDKGNNAAFSKALHEAYLWFKGDVPAVGNLPPARDTTAFSGGKYVSPAITSCGKNYIIFVANGGPGENTDGEARTLLQNDGGNVTQITYPTSLVGNSDQGNWADEFTRFLNSTADVSSTIAGKQNIITYAVAVTGSSNDGLYPNFMDSMAKYGGSGNAYRADSADKLTDTLVSVFNSIQAVNSVFTSASLPVSVNTQGTYKNQIFMGMFRPDALARPRWLGNLKQYQFSYNTVTQTLELVDSAGTPAINSATGFVDPASVSFWTSSSTFWVNSPSGSSATPQSDSPDGEVVEKGGAAQQSRTVYSTSQTGRKMLTCIGCTSTTTLNNSGTTAFGSSNASITTALLGAADATERDNIINWVRGTDNQGDELGPGGAVTVRPSLHGDVLHSRPVVIDYGGTTGTIAFYGANDGTLRAVDANQKTTATAASIGSATAGQELWSFVPEEMYSKLKRLRDNSPEVRLSTTSASLTSATPRDYFVDGPIGVWQNIDASGAVTKVYLFVGMRRGGRLLYVFDVTNPNAPKFLWKKTSSAVSVLGQTWSEPRVAKIKGNANPVVIMGAGYDATVEDASPQGTAGTIGNAVLVFDAETGAALGPTLATTRSVVADVTLLDSDLDGYADRGYAVDLGGNIYRIDFEDSSGGYSTTSWTIYNLASLGNGSSSVPRKFFYAPDVVQTKDFIGVLVGSGDREKPLNTTSDNRFYMIRDDRTAKGKPGTVTTITNSDVVAQSAYAASTTAKGCYIALATDGEKVVTGAVTVGGTTYFSTNKPTPPATNACTSNLGEAKAYGFPLFCGTPVTQVLTGGGLPPTSVTGKVSITLAPTTPGGTSTTVVVPFIIGGLGGSKASALAPSKVNVPVDPTRTRTYWYNESNR